MRGLSRYMARGSRKGEGKEAAKGLDCMKGRKGEG